jgi:outer membrane protein TolC
MRMVRDLLHVLDADATAQRPPRRAGRATLAVSAALVLAACGALPKVGPDYAGPPAQRSQAQAEAARTAPAVPPDDDGWQARLPHGGAQADLARWWAQFDDPALDAFLAAAQRESGSLAQAAARIEQARAGAVAANAAGLPTLDVTGAASRGTINIGTTILTATQARATAQANWEIDLFGRVAREREAATARLDQRAAEWHDARVSVAAEVAAQYLQYRYCEALVAIAQSDASSRAETATVSERAAAAGFQAPATAALTRASAAEAASRLTAQRADCDVGVKGLVALTGLPESDVRARLAKTAGRLPAPREFAVRTVPAGLLAQRPDLAAAERALAAASADIGAAEGDRYPRLSTRAAAARTSSRRAPPTRAPRPTTAARRARRSARSRRRWCACRPRPTARPTRAPRRRAIARPSAPPRSAGATGWRPCSSSRSRADCC